MSSSSHSVTLPSLTKELDVDLKKGLSVEERAKRLEKYGPNSLPTPPSPSIIKQIITQLMNPIVLLLLGTATIASLTGKGFDSALIFGIVIFMAAVGVFLERQSEKSLDQLKSLQATTTTVLIDGVPTTVPSESVVPGDVIVLQDGETIPADARVAIVDDVRTDEAALTGESLPVKKEIVKLPEETMLAEQRNMLFAGTAIVEGSTTALVVKTGKDTEVGKIATLLNQSTQSQTPLQQELEKIGKFLLYATLVSATAILSILMYRGQGFIESLMTTSSLAIAFVPEGLSAVLTVTLALAVSEMVSKKVIVKRLLAAEGLGSVTHIATDKTGTITEGRMHVVKLYLGGELYDINNPNLKKHTAYERLITIVRFCNNNKGPTEQALVNFLENEGFSFELEGRRQEYRFTSDSKRMSVIHETDGELKLLSKGAPDVLIPLCTTDIEASDPEFGDEQKLEALGVAEQLAGQGFRVLAVADKIYTPGEKKDDREKEETELCFVGLVALMDPLRATVKETVTGLKAAGVTPLMITGDHPAIARYIAKQAGIVKEGEDQVLTGQDLDKILVRSVLPENQEKLKNAKVFARVRPEHKVLLVDFYQQQGYRIAMTGDGVNDAAAIKRADVGIAMSNGVGLTKDISDVVITGSYDALLRAVAIGRTVKLRTQLYLHYLLSGNSCQVGIFFVAVFMNTPIPLTSVMLLLINLFTDALPAMAMAVEPEDPSVVKGRGNAQSSILSPVLLRGVVVQALISTTLLSIVFFYFLPQGTEVARTAVFTLYLFQKGLRAFTARSFTRSVFEYGFFTNRLMNIAIPSVFIAWTVMSYALPGILGLVRLPFFTVSILFGLATILPISEELTKQWNARLAQRAVAASTD
jgi:P-type Ca2+ transporter type 2C